MTKTGEKTKEGEEIKKEVSFQASKRETKEPAKCNNYDIGERITRETVNGNIVTLERVAPRGKKGNLCWKIISNTPAP